METEIRTYPKQDEFIELKAIHNLFVAGYGAGKTETKLLKLLISMLKFGKYGAVFALYEPTHDLLVVNTLPRLEEKLIQAGISYKLNKQEKIIRTEGYGTIFLRSMDTPARIVAYQSFYAFIDELETLRQKQIVDVWNKIVARNRQKLPKFPNEKNRTFTFTTPDAGFGFTYNTWGKSTDKNSFDYVVASTTDNPYLPSDYVQNLYEIYPEGMVKAFIHGEWTNISSGQVYEAFNRQTCHAKIEVPNGARLLVGQDFNVGGCVSVIGYQHQGVLYIIGEMVSNRTDEIRHNYDKRYPGHKATIYPDASGNNASSNASQTDIQILRNAGFAIKVNPSNPRVRDRVLSLNVAFSKGLCKIDTEACPRLTEALEQQAYMENGEPEKITGAATIDDWVDSLGYCNYAINPIMRPIASDVVVSA